MLRGPNFKNRRSMKQTGLFLFTALAVLCAACRYDVCLMTVLSVTAFASCSGDITESDGTTEQPENPGTPEDPDNPDGQDGQDAPDTPSGESNILVAYFSWSGNTQRMAQQIVSQTGADLFRIEPVTPYPEDYTECTEVALAERDSDARPAISTAVDADAWSGYDIVFIGCPVWWWTAPMIINTFTESYDFTGKTVVPFCTYASTYRDETLARIVELTPGAEAHLDGLGLTSGRLNVGTNVENWLHEIGMIK